MLCIFVYHWHVAFKMFPDSITKKLLLTLGTILHDVYFHISLAQCLQNNFKLKEKHLRKEEGTDFC